MDKSRGSRGSFSPFLIELFLSIDDGDDDDDKSDIICIQFIALH